MQYNVDFNKYYNSDKLLLTPNQRLARKLVAAGCTQIQGKNKVLTDFNIQSFNDFITQLFDLILETGLLDKPYFVLNNWQRELLFKQVIHNYAQEEHENYFETLSADSLYKKTVQAWSIAQQWQLDWSSWSNYLQPEAKLFCSWTQGYTDYLSKHHYLDPDDKLNIITSLLDTNPDLLKLLRVSSIDLYGFDDYSSQVTRFLAKLKDLSINVHILEQATYVDHTNIKVALYTAASQEDEYYAVAAWAKQQHDNNVSRIGIIVPDLAAHRAKLIKAFEELVPDRQVWNISGGDPLATIAVIKAALIILELLIFDKITLQDLRFLLKSNYYLKYITAVDNLAVPPDQFKLDSMIDQVLIKLQNSGYNELTLKEVISNLNIFNKPLADILNLSSQYLKDKELRLPSAWAHCYSKILQESGWPAGDSVLDCRGMATYHTHNISSRVYQAIGQWQSCLSQLALLDNIHGSVTSVAVYKDLKELLRNTPFQMQTDQNTIDILGMLEGAGISYERLWLFNLTSEVWPSAPDPNPFIPIDIQRKYNLPHATAERELEYAKRLTKRYLASAPDITISYTKSQGDHENHLSMLLPSIINSHVNIHSNAQLFSEQQNLFSMKQFVDITGPKITKAHIRSGVSAIRLQAICPFKAFSETRLNAVRNYKLAIGPTLQLRGEIIHKVLEFIFSEFNSKQKLSDFKSDAQRYNSKIHEIIYNSINLFKLDYKNIFTTGIIIIETELIYDIIDQWLELELARDDFTVLTLEKKYLLKLNNIEFNVRIDRIDQVANQQQDTIIIDYKTRKQNINNLFAEHLVEPQLPLYFMIEQLNNATAVLYGEVTDENPGYSGLSSTKLNIAGCTHVEQWEPLIAKWRATINTLADDYSQGKASVAPINKAQTCNQCHLSGLCRKDEYA